MRIRGQSMLQIQGRIGSQKLGRQELEEDDSMLLAVEQRVRNTSPEWLA
jgi:hypothetical protein